MTTPEDRLLRQEVEELTTLLREGHFDGDTRDRIANRGVDPSTCLLAAFMEGEEGQEYGWLVTSEGQALAWVWDAEGVRWTDVTEDLAAHRETPQVPIALAMHAEGAAVRVRPRKRRG